MKLTTTFFLCAISCGAQPFQNLNFESATPGAPISGPLGQFYQPIGLALPSWNAYLGTTLQSVALQNESTLNAAGIDILGPTSPPPNSIPAAAPGIIDGSFTVALQAGVANGFVSASIEQTGTIPAGDESLQFKAWAFTPDSTWSVSFAGNTLTLYALATTSQYTLYGADISSYSGQTGLLDFTAAGTGAPSFLELDDITFSTSSVPEPSPAVLIPLGGLLFVLRRNFSR